MINLPLTKLAETATTITLGWTPIPCLGYVLYADGVRKSNSWDQTKWSWKTNKAAEIRVVALGAAAEGVYPPPVVVPPTSGLRWEAPALDNPTTINLPQTGPVAISLDPAKDYILNLGDRRSDVETIGGRRIRAVGGSITGGFRSWVITGCTESVHIESVRFESATTAIAIRSPKAIVQVQKTRFNMNADPNSHRDCIHTWDGPKELRLDRVTMVVAGGVKAMLLMSDNYPTTAYVGKFIASRVNVRAATPGGSQPRIYCWYADLTEADVSDCYSDQGNYSPSHRYGLQDGWGMPNKRLPDGTPVSPGQWPDGYVFQPYRIVHAGVTYTCPNLAAHNAQPFNYGPVGRSDGDTMEWTNPMFRGKWTMGAPPGGDYVAP